MDGQIPQSASDFRELSFKQVVDQVFRPNGVKVGGFPEELFLDLTEEQKEKWICNICFLISNEPSECTNRHLFCRTCIFAWSLTHGENSQKCPMCRCDMDKYLRNKEIQKQLDDKRVHCQEADCTFRAPLKIYLMHSHGKKQYNNTGIDLESLRPPRQEIPRLLLLPAMGGRHRGLVLRSQIDQSRSMIHQMMLLLHLEMNLRQQALTSYTQTTDPISRLHRLDEVLALNEQLNEVGGILSNLLNSPMNQALAGGGAQASPSLDDDDDEPAIPSTSSALTSTSSLPTTMRSPLRISAPTLDDTEDESDSDTDSDVSDASAIRQRLTAIRQRREEAAAIAAGGSLSTSRGGASSQSQPPISTTMSSISATGGSSSIGPNMRARRPSEIRAGLSVVDSSSSSTSQSMASTSRGVTGTGSSGSTSLSRAQESSSLLSRSRDEPAPVRARIRPGISSSSTVQRISGDGLSTSESRNALPVISSASPRPDPALSPRVDLPESPRNPVVPAGSSVLHRTLQSMGEERSRSRARGSLTPRTTNGAFAASILNRSSSSTTANDANDNPRSLAAVNTSQSTTAAVMNANTSTNASSTNQEAGGSNTTTSSYMSRPNPSGPMRATYRPSSSVRAQAGSTSSNRQGETTSSQPSSQAQVSRRLSKSQPRTAARPQPQQSQSQQPQTGTSRTSLPSQRRLSVNAHPNAAGSNANNGNTSQASNPSPRSNPGGTVSRRQQQQGSNTRPLSSAATAPRRDLGGGVGTTGRGRREGGGGATRREGGAGAGGGQGGQEPLLRARRRSEIHQEIMQRQHRNS